MNKDLVNKLSDDEFKKIILSSNSLSEVGRKLGFAQKPGKNSKNKIKNRIIDLGLEVPIKKYNISDAGKNAIIKSNIQRRKNLPVKYCKNCNKKLSESNMSGYCYNCLVDIKNYKKIQFWKETGETGCSVNTTLRNCIRAYIYKKQNYQCAICNMKNFWNNKQLNFILDHIDGDASNNFESNLRLICPNCDAQLDTYKSKNKNSKRSNKSHN